MKGRAAEPDRYAGRSGHRGSVRACWHWNRQATHPPAAACRRRIEPNAANATAAATAAHPAATAIATISAAASKKCPTGRPNTTISTSTTTAILIAGRA